MYIFSTHASTPTSSFISPTLELLGVKIGLYIGYALPIHIIHFDCFGKYLRLDSKLERCLPHRVCGNEATWLQVFRLPLNSYVILDKSYYLLNTASLLVSEPLQGFHSTLHLCLS